MAANPDELHPIPPVLSLADLLMALVLTPLAVAVLAIALGSLTEVTE